MELLPDHTVRLLLRCDPASGCADNTFQVGRLWSFHFGKKNKICSLYTLKNTSERSYSFFQVKSIKRPRCEKLKPHAGLVKVLWKCLATAAATMQHFPLISSDRWERHKTRQDTQTQRDCAVHCRAVAIGALLMQSPVCFWSGIKFEWLIETTAKPSNDRPEKLKVPVR